jgi:hypothetical protein
MCIANDISADDIDVDEDSGMDHSNYMNNNGASNDIPSDAAAYRNALMQMMSR